MKRITIMLLALVALVLAACTDSQGASPTATPTEDSEAAAAESEAADDEPADESAAALPSFELPDSAPELAALLPDEIGGEEAFKLSMSGEELMAGQDEDVTVDQEFLDFLSRVGAQPDDISVAFAFGMGTDEATAGIFAFRIAGANASQLESEFRAAMEAESDAVIDWQETSVAGKNVLAGEDPDNPGNTMYLYTTGDIIFIVTAGSEDAAEELLQPLP